MLPAIRYVPSRDPDFDIAGDANARDKCLHGLFPERRYTWGLSNTSKRVSDLFERNPTFVEDYGNPQPAIQGVPIGNCWFMSALTSVARDSEFRDSRESWLQQICVAVCLSSSPSEIIAERRYVG